MSRAKKKGDRAPVAAALVGIRPQLEDAVSYLDDADHEAGYIAATATSDHETIVKLVGALHMVRAYLETIESMLDQATQPTVSE